MFLIAIVNLSNFIVCYLCMELNHNDYRTTIVPIYKIENLKMKNHIIQLVSKIACSFVLLLGIHFNIYSQRIIPNNYKWTSTLGGYISGNYGTSHQFNVSELSGGTSGLLGYGVGFKYEYQTYYTRRYEFGASYQLRSYLHSEADFKGFPPVETKIDTHFLNFYARYKLLQHTRYFSLYLAPGLTFDLELNHPLINRNSSGIGALIAGGYETRIGKKWLFFMEGEAKLQALLHFKNEENPYRHIGVQVNVGFSRIL